MAAPTYTTDLSTLNLCENSGTFGEYTGMDDGGSPDETDQDDVIQGSYLCSAQCSLKVGELQSIYVDYGSGVTVPTDGAILMWNKFDAGGLLEAYTSGGVRIVIGASAVNWDAWKAGGVDKTPNPYGGWFNFALNPLARTYDYRGGSGTGTTYQFAGMAISLTADGPSKGQPFKIDAIRFGRCTIIIEYGSSGDGYANFGDAAAKNDNNEVTEGYNRWGLFSVSGGGYLWKGRMQIGTANACEFVASDAFILVDDVVNCTANFNTIEINHVDTTVNWTNIIFKSLGTQSPGRLVMNHNTDLTWTACQFFDMGAFSFGGTNSSAPGSTFSGCGLITTEGGTFDSCTFNDTSDAAKAVIVSSPANAALITNSTFISGGTGHGLEIGGTADNLTLTGATFTGYDTANPGTAANKAIYVNIISGTVNLTVSGGSGITQNYHVRSAGATVNIIAGAVDVDARCVKTDGTALEDVRVYMAAAAKSSGTATTDTASKLVDTNATFDSDGVVVGDIAFNKTDGASAAVTGVDSETSLSLASDAFPDGNEDYRVGGAFPDEDTVTISNSGTTATVTHTGHGMSSNDNTYIEGGDQVGNEGVYQINFISANSYSYTMLSSPSSPTGTITSTFVALFGSSDANGEVSTSRIYSVDQPVAGWARNTISGAPYYQEGIITGTITTSGGLSATAVLVSDE
jgi:hypothetical protein